MADDGEGEEAPGYVEKLSDTGLFYLYYTNDSGAGVSASATRDMTAELFRRMDLARAEQEDEARSALVLQAAARRRMARAMHGGERHLSLRLQRAYRGHLGRLSFERGQQERDRALRQAFWDQNATLVQKMFRGFWSRKYRHNYYIRQYYLMSVAQKGEEIREQIERHYATSRAQVERKTAEDRLESFEKVVGSLHHMMSTASCAGVYNSPYHQASRATVYGMRVEEHLDNVAKGTLRESILRFGVNTGLVPVGEEHAETAGGGGTGLYAYSTRPIQITRAH